MKVTEEDRFPEKLEDCTKKSGLRIYMANEQVRILDTQIIRTNQSFTIIAYH